MRSTGMTRQNYLCQIRKLLSAYLEYQPKRKRQLEYSSPVLKPVCQIKVSTVIETPIAQQLLQIQTWIFKGWIPSTKVLPIWIRGIRIDFISHNTIMLGAIETIKFNPMDPLDGLPGP